MSIKKKAFQQGKRRKMTKFTIDELSSVDHPAQTPAVATIMKRQHTGKPDDDEKQKVKKFGFITVVTSADDGHGHILEFWPGDDHSGHTDWAIGPGEHDEEHRHAWFIDEEGQIQIVMNAGHLHAVERDTVVNSVVAMVSKGGLDEKTLERIQKNFPEITTTEETNVDEKEVQALQKNADRLNSIVGLSTAHRAHFDSLEKVESQDEFLAKSATERDVIVTESAKAAEKASETNSQEVYTARDGRVFTKSDDPMIVAAIIHADSLEKKVDALEKRDSDREIAKRAETELGNLPGTIETRTALLKSVESITDEGERKAALKALTAANEAASINTEALGTLNGANVPDVGSPQAELDKLAKTEQAANGGTFEAAFTKACDTPEGRVLYNKHRESMNQLPH
jgi:hypothetical protein